MTEGVLRLQPGTAQADTTKAKIPHSQSSGHAVSLQEVLRSASSSLSSKMTRPKAAHARPNVRPEVIAIVEQSLREHADIWTELAKY